MNEFQNIDSQMPYNPNDVDIRQQTFAVGQLMHKIIEDEIDLKRVEEYQRNSTAWSVKQKSLLIESLLMRIPLPIFYFDGSESPWKIIDGLHRLTTIFSFLNGESFKLTELEYLKDLNGLTFFDLPFKYQRVIEQFLIEAYIINPGTPNKVKFNIFHRINTLGKSLTAQEIRNANYRGEPVEFLNKLASSEIFLKATQGNFPTKKLKDKEVVLRFIAFFKFFDYYKSPLESFLNQSMESMYKFNYNDREHLMRVFESSMNVCSSIFEENAFYSLNINGERHSSKINVALFEIWAVNLAKCDNYILEMLVANKQKVKEEFIMLLQNSEFHKSISYSTSSKKAIHTRFTAIQNLIKNISDANRR
jgi:Protein of unknown function DUF262